jgi:hypothetical protein
MVVVGEVDLEGVAYSRKLPRSLDFIPPLQCTTLKLVYFMFNDHPNLD